MTPRIAPLPAPRRRLDRRLKVSLASVAVSGAALGLGALLTFGTRAGFSVALGGAIATANLWTLAYIVAALLPDGPDPRNPSGEPQGARNTGAWALIGGMKLLALVAAVWVLLRGEIVSALPLLTGFAALPIGIAIGSLVSDRASTATD